MADRISIPKAIKPFLPYLLLLPGLFLILYYLIGPAAGYMTADCTDSIRWAQATYESGHLISKDFSYAAVQPFGGNLIFLPFLAVFGYSMKAQIAGLVLFALLLTASVYYLARGLNLKRWESSAFVTLFALLLSSSPKLREILWEHIFYYNLGILFFCLGFGLALRLTREEGLLKSFSAYGTRDWIRLGALVLFSFLAATDGLQTLVCFTLPILGAFVLEFFLFDRPALPLRHKMALGYLMCLILFWSALGFAMIPLFTRGVEAGYANAYSTYSPMNEWMDNFLGIFHNWLTLFGVSVSQGDPLVSLDSVINMMRIAGAFLLLFFPFVLLFKYRKQADRPLRLLIGGHLFVSAFIVFASTFGSLGKANWRLTPMLGTAVLVLLAWSFKALRSLKSWKFGLLSACFLVLLASVSAGDILSMPANYGENDSWHESSRQLQARGLKYGYANFWWAERITLVSGNQVQVANVNESNGKPVANDYQLPAGSFEDKDTDRYFLLLTESDNKKMKDWLNTEALEGRLIDSFIIQSDPYSSGGFVGNKVYVYVFGENLF